MSTSLMMGLDATYFSRRFEALGLDFDFRFVKAIPAGTALTLEWTITRSEPEAVARRPHRVASKGVPSTPPARFSRPARGSESDPLTAIIDGNAMSQAHRVSISIFRRRTAISRRRRSMRWRRSTAARSNWRPILLGVVFKQTGMAPLTEIPIKGDYSRARLRAQRALSRHGVQDAAGVPDSRRRRRRASCSGRRSRIRRRGAGGARVVPRVLRRRPRHLEARHRRRRGGEGGRRRGGGARERRRPGDQGCTQTRSRRARSRAGVFGSPFVIVDGEPFWGVDRFDQLERWLATGGF